MQDALKRQNERLEQTVLERTRQLQASRIEIIWRLAKAAEFRDEQTGSHVVRVAHYCRIIAEALGQSREFVETVFLSAPLHDLGKIGIPDAILHKPGRLTDEERLIVQTHCEIGERILSEWRDSQQSLLFDVEKSSGRRVGGEEDPVLRMAARSRRRIMNIGTERLSAWTGWRRSSPFRGALRRLLTFMTH